MLNTLTGDRLKMIVRQIDPLYQGHAVALAFAGFVRLAVTKKRDVAVTFAVYTNFVFERKVQYKVSN